DASAGSGPADAADRGSSSVPLRRRIVFLVCWIPVHTNGNGNRRAGQALQLSSGAPRILNRPWSRTIPEVVDCVTTRNRRARPSPNGDGRARAVVQGPTVCGRAGHD